MIAYVIIVAVEKRGDLAVRPRFAGVPCAEEGRRGALDANGDYYSTAALSSPTSAPRRPAANWASGVCHHLSSGRCRVRPERRARPVRAQREPRAREGQVHPPRRSPRSTTTQPPL